MSVLTNVAQVQELARDLAAVKPFPVQPNASWAVLVDAFDKLVADRAALYAACVAVSAVEDEANSKALTDAAIVASDARMA